MRALPLSPEQTALPAPTGQNRHACMHVHTWKNLRDASSFMMWALLVLFMEWEIFSRALRSCRPTWVTPVAASHGSSVLVGAHVLADLHANPAPACEAAAKHAWLPAVLQPSTGDTLQRLPLTDWPGRIANSKLEVHVIGC